MLNVINWIVLNLNQIVLKHKLLNYVESIKGNNNTCMFIVILHYYVNNNPLLFINLSMVGTFN